MRPVARGRLDDENRQDGLHEDHFTYDLGLGGYASHQVGEAPYQQHHRLQMDWHWHEYQLVVP